MPLAASTVTLSTPPSFSSPEIPDRRRCWECLRRRLVCDAIKPVCNKCRVAGIVCPGYDDKKPLTWLAPGKVTCRTRRKPRKAEVGNKTQKIEKPKPGLKQKEVERVPKRMDSFLNEIECILHSELRTDVCDVYEAVQYYNAVFYPYAKSGHSTNANVFVDEIPLKVVKYLPTAIAHNVVAVVFQHRMCVQTEWKLDCPSVKHARARLHHHRGISIRALNADVANEKTQSSDLVLTGVMLLLQSEITSCISPHWRHHVSGLLAMLAYRGGAVGWVRSAPHLSGVLLSFLVTMVAANTTSPSFDQVIICPHEEFMALTQNLYLLGLHPYMPCPMPLFVEIVRINHLRAQTSCEMMSWEAARFIADDIVDKVESFDQEGCTAFYEDKEQHQLVSLAFQSAVVVFCISSLQSLGVLPSTRRMAVLRTLHSNRLYFLLDETKKHIILRKSIQWPLIVAGVEAGSRVDKRRLVAELLVEQGKDIGTPLPFHAKGVLRKFWDGEDTDWDACFDQPYAFVS